MSIASLEDIRIIVMVVIVVVKPQGRAKRPSQLADLECVALITMTPGGQVTIAERRACQKVLWNGFFSGLLPRDVDQERLERPGVRMPTAHVEEGPVSRSGVGACTCRKRGFRFKDGFEVGSQFPILLTALKRPAGGDGRIKIHDVHICLKIMIRGGRVKAETEALAGIRIWKEASWHTLYAVRGPPVLGYAKHLFVIHWFTDVSRANCHSSRAPRHR